MTDVQLFFDGDVTPVNQRNSVYEWDDFRNAGGDLTWLLAGTGATLTQNVNAAHDHPGRNDLSTDTTSGHDALITRSDYYEDRVQTLEWSFMPASSFSSVVFRLGLMNSFTSPTDGLAVEYDTGASDTALSLVKWVGGVRTVGATLALPGNKWYRMNWSRSGSGAGALTLNNTDDGTSQTYAISGLSTVFSWKAGAYVKTTTTAARTLTLDWFQASLANMSR